MSLLGDPLYEHAGMTYDLTVTDVAKLAGHTRSWVHMHRVELGGITQVWDDGKRSLRFSSEVIDERLHYLGALTKG